MPESTQKNNTDEINLADLIRVYIVRWLFLGIISVLVALTVFIVIRSMNRSAGRTKLVFEFIYPEYTSGLYPDGTNFRYQDFVSEDFLKKAIASDASFSKYSATDILKGNLIEISQYTEAALNDEKEIHVVNGKFVFNVRTRYFGSAENIIAFLNALIDVAADKVLSSANTVYYQLYLDSFDSADTFSNKLSYLKQQENYIKGRYQSWIEQYGEQYTVRGMTLSRYLQNVNQAFTDKEYSSLSYELQKRQYVYNRSDDEELVCRLKIEILNDEFEDNKKKIAGLTEALAKLREGENKGNSDITGPSNEAYYYTQIATYTERQVDIEREITDIEVQIANMNMVEETKAYNDKLIAIRDRLQKQTEILEKTIAPAVYDEKTVAEIDLSTVKSVGGKSAVLFAAIAFVAMYVIVGFILFILGDDGSEKKKYFPSFSKK